MKTQLHIKKFCCILILFLGGSLNAYCQFEIVGEPFVGINPDSELAPQDISTNGNIIAVSQRMIDDRSFVFPLNTVY